MEEVLLGYNQFVKEPSSDDSYYGTAVAKYKSGTAGEDCKISLDLKIENSTEQLQQLKFQFLEVATKHLFIQKIANSNHDLPCPSMQELAAAELEAEQQKSKLKKAKLARRDAQESFEEICRLVSEAASAESEARSSLSRRVEEGMAGLRLRNVTQILENGTAEDIQALAANVGEHGAKACERLLTNIFDQLTEANNTLADEERQVTSLQNHVDQNARDHAALNAQVFKYRTQIENNERQNEAASSLREESLRHEALYNALSAITRTKIGSIEADSVCMEIAVDRRFECDDVKTLHERNSITNTYQLKMTVPDQAAGIVTSLTLTPPDINVVNLVSPCRPLTLSQVTHEVIQRLQANTVASPEFRK